MTDDFKKELAQWRQGKLSQNQPANPLDALRRASQELPSVDIGKEKEEFCREFERATKRATTVAKWGFGVVVAFWFFSAFLSLATLGVIVWGVGAFLGKW